MAGHFDRQLTADRQAELARGRGRDQRRRALSDEIGGAGERLAPARLATVVAGEIGPEVAIDERIDSEQVKTAPRTIRRLAATAPERHVTLDDRRGTTHADVDAEPAIEVVGQPRRPAEDLMRRPAADGLGGQPERAERTAVGEVAGHGNGHAERDAQDGQPELPRVRAQLPRGEAREHHRGRSTSAPRWMAKIRSATPTTSRLWVTISTVRPASRASVSSRSSTAVAVSASRLPVGSSARMSAG